MIRLTCILASILTVAMLTVAVNVTSDATEAQATQTIRLTATPTAKPTPTQTATAKPTPKMTKRSTPTATPKPTKRPTPKPARSGLRAGDTLRGSLTYYCCCPKCCGKHVKRISPGVYRSKTASGMKVQTGKAPPYPIASCNWLPLGSQVEAGGVVYTIEDRGGGGLSRVGNLDVYVESHAKALKLGRRGATIKIVRIGR